MRGMDGYMRGVNLGGWLSQFDAPTKEHFDTFITEDDIRRIAGLGLDHVRVPVDYTVIETEDGEPIEEGYRYIDNCVQWCRENGLGRQDDLLHGSRPPEAFSGHVAHYREALLRGYGRRGL